MFSLAIASPSRAAAPTSSADADAPDLTDDAPVDALATGLVMLEVRPEVQAAHAAAEQALTAGECDAALRELQYVLTAAPHWAAAYRLRAQVFARLAAEHPPGAAFLRAQAHDLAYVVELEPDAFDRGALEHEVDALYRRSNEAARLEARRRKLRVPAIVVTTLGIGALSAGALLLGISPSDKPSAPGHRENDIGGAITLAAGAGLAIAAAVLGGLARRQSKRDAAVTSYYELATRRVEWTAGPALTRGGGGLALGLRF